MKNPFVQPAQPLERVKAAQVCPHCLAQVYTVWGQDLRERGRCPACKKRIYRLNTVMHSRRDMLLVVGVDLAVLIVVASLILYQHFFG